MPTPEQTPKIEDVVNNSYLQQEIDLSQNIIAAIKDSPEIFSAVEVWEKSTSHQQRMSSELEEFREIKNKMEATIADIKHDFGSEDSFADLKKIEECESKLKAVLEVIPLLEQKLDSGSNHVEEIRKDKGAVEHAVRLALNNINIQLQEDIDAKVNDLRQTLSMYNAAIERVRTEQKLIPSKLLAWNTLRTILPEIKEFGDSMPLNPLSFHQGVGRGLAKAKEKSI